jgi:hypothetical protein
MVSDALLDVMLSLPTLHALSRSLSEKGTACPVAPLLPGVSRQAIIPVTVYHP